MFSWLRDSWLSLLRIFSGDREPHSILLYGKDGLGKKEIARELAKFYLCFNKCGSGYCGSCPSCQNFSRNTHGDFIVIGSENGSKIGIDEIREMIDTVSMTAKMGHGKVVIIENAELLTVSAANSMLKILEEPFPDLLFILTADSLLKLIPTILSRCVKFKINDPDFNMAVSWMRDQVTDKSVDLKHLFLLNNYSPVDTVRFVNANQHHHINRLIKAVADFVYSRSNPAAVIDILKDITKNSPYNKADEEQKDKKSKPKELVFRIIYPWLYYIVSDIYRSRVTGSLRENYFIKTERLLEPFKKIPVHVLHESLEQLIELSRSDQILETSFIDLYIINWLNSLARKQ